MHDQITLVAIQSLIALTMALIVVLCLRSAVRRCFGSAQSYLLWGLVPLLPSICVASLFAPQLALPVPSLHVTVLPSTVMHAAASDDSLPVVAVLGTLWAIGAAVQLCLQLLHQHRFMQQLGPLRDMGTIYQATSNAFSPALIGAWRPHIVVPADFALRYSTEEQEIIVQHEMMHRRRGDHLANLLCAVLLSLFWFHPLLRFCIARFRCDQEMACDAAVLALKKNSRKTYANALLKASAFNSALPATCHWQSQPILKERIMQLSSKAPRSSMRFLGRLIVLAIIGTGAGLTWAAQSAPAATNQIYNVTMVVTSNGGAPVSTTIKVKDGETFTLVGGEKDQWSGRAKLSGANDNSVKYELALAHANQPAGKPTVIAHIGEPAKVKLSDGGVAFEFKLTAAAASVK